MRALMIVAVLGLAVAGGSSAEAAGCLKGAAVGGVAGHFMGHHGGVGAAAGCAIGHHEANKARDSQPTSTSTPQSSQN